MSPCRSRRSPWSARGGYIGSRGFVVKESIDDEGVRTKNGAAAGQWSTAVTDRRSGPHTLDQIRRFLDGDHTIDLRIRTRGDVYRFIEQTLRRFDYSRLRRADRGVLRQFLTEVTGLSRAQFYRLLNQHRATGEITDRRGVPRRPFLRRYTDADIELLAEIDILHGAPSGPVARKLCARAHYLFGDYRFERLARISNGHLYNLRRSRIYRRHRGAKSTGDRPLLRALGERGRPRPPELPGNLQVSSLHVDAGAAGLHYLGFVDEATRFRFVSSVERVDTAGVAAVLDGLQRTFPFNLRRFRADSGSAPVGRDVAALLESLHRERRNRLQAPRGCAVPEVRNASAAERVNAFARRSLSPYLNYHRLCVFPAEQLDDEDDAATHFPRAEDIMTPYERLKSLPGAEACLTSGTTFAELDDSAAAMSDNEAARLLTDACRRLFRSLKEGD